MKLYDEEEVERKRGREKKIKSTLIISIVSLIILSIALIAIIIHRSYNPDKITTYIDGKKIDNFDSILDFETDENGKTKVYVPIRDVAEFFGYKSFNGEYNIASEDEDKCYVIKEGVEVANFALNSKIIYKLDLQNKTGEYNYWYTDKSVFKSNGKLYTSVDGIEQGYNVSFSYDEKKKIINIRTMDSVIAEYTQKYFENNTLGNYGKVEIDDNFQNWKAIFDGMLVIKTENDKFGVLDASKLSVKKNENGSYQISDYKFALEPKYDNIEYVQYSSDFLVQSNGKIGIISKEGATKVTASYDELTLMDRDTNLYKTRKDNLYGVIDSNENVIVYPENEQIGIDISGFAQNGIKSGYIVLGNLIPVKKDNKWGFYNIKGKQITDFKYDQIGYKMSNSNNRYSLLEITNYGVIVIGQGDKYTFMDEKGDDTILPLVFDQIYIQVSSGEKYYVMTKGEKRYDALKILVKQGVNEKTK